MQISNHQMTGSPLAASACADLPKRSLEEVIPAECYLSLPLARVITAWQVQVLSEHLMNRSDRLRGLMVPVMSEAKKDAEDFPAHRCTNTCNKSGGAREGGARARTKRSA